jgi:site-specific recombinase XerD
MGAAAIANRSALAQAEVVIERAVVMPESQRAYVRAVRQFVAWFRASGHTALTKTVVHDFRSDLMSQRLAPATINQKLSAVRRLATELSDAGLLSTWIASGISRVKGVRQCGVRSGNWLSRDQAQTFLDVPDSTTIRGIRDRAIIAVLLCCGLRRNEVALLETRAIQLRAGRWMLLDIKGKHGRIRSVPMSGSCKDVIDAWLSAAEIKDGRVFRAVDKSGRVWGRSLSAQAVYEIVRGYGTDLGMPVTPHDLRRSFARLAHVGSAPLEQIQLSLGHSSVATTERYVGVHQDLTNPPCDRLAIVIPNMHTHDESACLQSVRKVHRT